MTEVWRADEWATPSAGYLADLADLAGAGAPGEGAAAARG